MNSKTLWIILAVIIVAGLAWWLLSMNNAPAQPSSEATTTGQVQGASDQFTDNSKDGAADSGAGVGVSVGASAGAGAPVSAFTVKYTNNGFEPSTITVPAGTTVTFINQSSENMWIASNNHPDHTLYDGTSKDVHCAPGYTGPAPLDECSTGSTFTFTFTKAGTFGYHNHADHDMHGTVIVTP